ncbi:hypothetical protein E4T56_gene13510 [Termitomyces sp. T112]|nr:hypothetical protein E4T56_gene13510 [Termitomyces sp. T112]
MGNPCTSGLDKLRRLSLRHLTIRYRHFQGNHILCCFERSRWRNQQPLRPTDSETPQKLTAFEARQDQKFISCSQ